MACFTGKAIMCIEGIRNPLIKGKVQDEFLRLYNEYVDLSNPEIEGINNEFEFWFPTLRNKCLNEDDGSMEKYNNFISKKFQKLADKVNENNSHSLVELWIDPETAVCHGRLKDKPESDIWFEIRA